jgi:dihydrofolate reductase
MDRNRLIGKDNQLPWRLPADMQHFRQVTLGHSILMGRLTWESLGKPLPERRNLVLSRQHLELDGAELVNSLEQAIDLVKQGESGQELMVIGGAQVYAAALPMAQRLYLTQVEGEFQGDTWFPEWDEREWTLIDEALRPTDDKNAYSMRFVTLERTS